MRGAGLAEEQDRGNSFGSDPRQPEAWQGVLPGRSARFLSVTSAPCTSFSENCRLAPRISDPHFGESCSSFSS